MRKISKELDYDMLSGLSEFGIDNLMSNDVLKDFPIIGTVVGLFKTQQNISNALSIRKLSFFLAEFEKVSDKDYHKMCMKLQKKEERNKFGERILLVLDAITETKKATLMGKAFKAYAENKIDRVDLDRIYHVLENCYLEDLKTLAQADHNLKASLNISVLPLYSQGLYKFTDNMRGLGEDYHKTKLGYLVSHVLFDTKMPTDAEYGEYIK